MIAMWKCKVCGEIVKTEDDEDIEENLWSHIQMNHEEEFHEMQDWCTPYMIDNCYESINN